MGQARGGSHAGGGMNEWCDARETKLRMDEARMAPCLLKREGYTKDRVVCISLEKSEGLISTTLSSSPHVAIRCSSAADPYRGTYAGPADHQAMLYKPLLRLIF